MSNSNTEIKNFFGSVIAGKMKKSFGDRSFSVSVLTLWNVLPAYMRNISSIFIFKLAFSL